MFVRLMSHDIQNPLLLQANEELAGPIVQFTPVQREDRISAIDVLRGFALLGILVMNIDSFGSIESSHDIPTIESFYGPHGYLNFAVLLFQWLFFEGKIRGIFSMLFGAGVLLLTTRAEKRGAAASVADVYTRRNMLLALFGLLHGIFIWDGDILFDYGLCALLYLYPARKLKATALITIGVVVSLTLGTFTLMGFTNSFENLSLGHQIRLIQQREVAHQSLTPAELTTLREWQKTVEQHAFPPAEQTKLIAEGRGPYRQHLQSNLGHYFGGMAMIHVATMPETISAMLLGMGLYKLGFLTGEIADSIYWITGVAGFALSLPIYLWGFFTAYRVHFDFLTIDRWIVIPYEFTRTAGMLAIVAVIMLLIKRRVFKRLQYWLSAVGKMALSNYVGTSLLCQLLFVWTPWKLYGRLEYYQLMYVVGGIWAVNLITSTLWLRYFEFGPLEWLWRSLTYWEVQPLRIKHCSQ